jgi:hypothetical protein
MPWAFAYMDGGSKTPSSHDPEHHVGFCAQSSQVSPSLSAYPGISMHVLFVSVLSEPILSSSVEIVEMSASVRAQLTKTALEAHNQLGILFELLCPKHCSGGAGGGVSYISMSTSSTSSSTAVVFVRFPVELSAVRRAFVSLCEPRRHAWHQWIRDTQITVESTQQQHN